MQDLYNELWERLKLADEAISDMRKCGRDYASSKAEYRKRLAAEIAALRLEGKPATLVGDLARGCDEVADLCFARDCAQVLYDAARETVMLRKKEADVIREQMAREWSQ